MLKGCSCLKIECKKHGLQLVVRNPIDDYSYCEKCLEEYERKHKKRFKKIANETYY